MSSIDTHTSLYNPNTNFISEDDFKRFCEMIIEFENNEMKSSWDRGYSKKKKSKPAALVPTFNLKPQMNEMDVSLLRQMCKTFNSEEPRYVTKEIIEQLGCSDNIRKASKNFHRLKTARIWRRKDVTVGDEILKMNIQSYYTGEQRVVLIWFNAGKLIASHCSCPAG